MNRRMKLRATASWLALSVMFATSPAWAEKPEWAGNHGDKHGKHGKKGDDDDQGENRGGDTSVSVNFRFGDNERRIISDYYQTQAHAGHCPPGLAKKNNGCLPPGQAKKWARGRPIGTVEYHDLPHDLRARLPAPPAGHRYVQVAADVLLIAVGTGVVVDAVEDLMR